MRIDLAIRRRFLAEELAATCDLRTAALVDALATIPREAFLGPGPWLVRGEGDANRPPRWTPDDDPAHVCHNVAVAIDPARQLFNGAPSILALAIDALGLAGGQRVLHLGCGLGYYTALLAHVVGEAGRVLALEVDADLAAEAARRLAPWPWVEVRHSNGADPLDGTFDAMLINAGVTHPRDHWLDAVAAGGRLVLPLTVTMPAMGPIGKGPLLVLRRGADGAFDVRAVTLVAIYSAVDLRDEARNAALGRAMMGGGMLALPTRLRRDAHEPGPACWLHVPGQCFSRN